MSHPQPGKDYSDKHKEESSKSYSLRKKKGESAGRMSKGHKAIALIRSRNKAELDHSAAFDKKFGSFEDRLKRYGKDMKK